MTSGPGERADDDTGLRLWQGEQWLVAADTSLIGDTGVRQVSAYTVSHGAQCPAATLRRIGWLDQKGRVWLAMPAGDFDGGSLTPLLIDARED